MPSPVNKHQDILHFLLKPPLTYGHFGHFLNLYKRERLVSVLDEVYPVLQRQPSLLRLRCPAKIFGDLFGQYSDLLSFFAHNGYPTE
jgi:hypothetical protein